jgi:hypothetical protein
MHNSKDAWATFWSKHLLNETAPFEKSNQLFDCQNLLLLSDIWGQCYKTFSC